MMKHSRPGYLTRNLVVAPAERISNIIAESHGSLLGGHDGSNKTVERILQHYWFPGVHSETDFFIENCPTCNRNKKKSDQQQVDKLSALTKHEDVDMETVKVSAIMDSGAHDIVIPKQMIVLKR